MPHHVYLVRCADGTLYTGYATDVARRLRQHDAGKGARYTRGRGPVELLGTWAFPTAGDALREERRIKALPRTAKLALVVPDPGRTSQPLEGAGVASASPTASP